MRVDGTGATHDLLGHLEALNTARCTVRYTVGWKIGEADEQAITKLPESAWETSLHQDGTLQEGYVVAVLTALNTRGGWPAGMRLIVRRVKPSRRQMKNLTAFEIRTGWRYSVTATNIRHRWGIPGSQHAPWLNALHRSHAVMEDRVRRDKARGLHNLPSQSWTVNRGWMLATNLADAEPDTLRYRRWHLSARLVRHARRRVVKIPDTWPWRTAFTTCWQRLTALPVAPT